MAARKPVVIGATGQFEQLQSGDTLDAPVTPPDIAVTLLTPTISEVIATNTSGITFGFYEITGSLSLTINENGKFLIT